MTRKPKFGFSVAFKALSAIVMLMAGFIVFLMALVVALRLVLA